MVSDKLKEMAEEARRDGFMIFDTSGGPIRLDGLFQLVQDIFPTLSLHQLAIIQAEDDKFVVAAELDTKTKSN